MKKVIIFGANGGIGKHAVKHALDRGYLVTAYLRSPEKLELQHENLTIVKGTIDDYKTMLSAVTGQDAVLWCIGIPMKRNYEKMESLEGHQNLIRAMQEAGVKRLIDYATPSVSFEKDTKSFITVVPGIMAGILFKKAKQECVAIGDVVRNSGLDWTLVRFMAPQNTPYKGKVKVGFGDVKMKFAISREDIGAFMVRQIERDKYIHSMPIIGS